MNWNEFLGHEPVIERFNRALSRGRLASSFLFVGLPGIGKRTFARLFAKSLLCERNDGRQLTCCGVCPACQQVEADSHPDFEMLRKPDDKSFIPVELLIGDREHRMREGLCHRISLRPFSGGRKIAIIDDADFLNQEGANCLLKTLEEPPEDSVIILIGTSEQRQLPTIRSRCQTVRFAPLADDQLARLLLAQELVPDQQTADELAKISHGSLASAAFLIDPAIREFREIFLMQLATLDPGRDGFLKELSSFVDAAGKEASLKRDRMRVIADWAILFYRHWMWRLSQAESESDDPIILRAVNAAVSRGNCNAEVAGDCVHRCLETHRHIASNANQATMLESWLSDLGKICRNQYVGVLG